MPREYTDAELLDALESYIRREPLTIWLGDGQYPGGRMSGLSLLGGKRSLRDALAVIARHKTLRNRGPS